MLYAPLASNASNMKIVKTVKVLVLIQMKASTKFGLNFVLAFICNG